MGGGPPPRRPLLFVAGALAGAVLLLLPAALGQAIGHLHQLWQSPPASLACFRQGPSRAQRTASRSAPPLSDGPAGPFPPLPGDAAAAVPGDQRRPAEQRTAHPALTPALLLTGALAALHRLWTHTVAPPLAGQSARSAGTEEEEEVFAEFLAWLTAHGTTPNPPPVALRVGPNGLRGLYATRDLRPGEVVLSVPHRLFLVEPRVEPGGRGPPSLTLMALELLRRRRDPDWAPYFRLLPPDCRTPTFHFSEEALKATEDPHAIQRTMWNRTLALKSIPQLEEGTSPEDFLWALAILSSRCFEQVHMGADQSVLVPGVDLVNHSCHPTAVIRWHAAGPDACMQLAARDAGLRAGEEVTIRYSNGPTQDYFLSHGFVPEDNPYDFAVVFEGPEELAEACRVVLSDRDPSANPQDFVKAISLCGVPCNDLYVSPKGVDPRLRRALEGICPLEDFLVAVAVHGCQRCLAQYSTGLAEDEAVLEAGGLDPDVAMAIKYRVAQKRILQGVVELQG
eukprot:EG_transcript_8236